MLRFVQNIETFGLSGPGNPGHGIWAFAVVTSSGWDYHHASGYMGNYVSSIEAEYRALIEALRYCEQQDWYGVTIRVGLAMLVEQLRGEVEVPFILEHYWQEAKLLQAKTGCSIERQAKNSVSLAAIYAREAYWKARNRELQPEPLVLQVKLTETAIVSEANPLEILLNG